MPTVPPPALRPAVVLAVTAVVAYAWAAAALRPFTLPALAATLTGGVVAMAVGARLLPPAAPPRFPRAGGAWLWGLLAGAAALWQLQAFVQHPRAEHPTISSLTNDLLQSHPPRAAAILMWLGAAVWLARR